MMRAALVLVIAQGVLVAQHLDCPYPDRDPNAPVLSRFCAQIVFVKGKSTVGAYEFTSNGSLPDSAGAELAGFLKTELERLEPPYRAALDEQGRVRDDHGQMNDELTNRLRTFDGAYEEFAGVFQAWYEDDPEHRSKPEDVLSAAAHYRSVQTIQERAPLLYVDFAEDLGRLMFEVPQPFDARSVALHFAGPNATAKRERQVRSWLGGISGLWRPDLIVANLREFYRRLGFDPVITPQMRVNAIDILEARRVARIVFPNGLPRRAEGPDWRRVDQCLYILLDDRAFRKYVGNREKIREKLQGADLPAIDLTEDLGAGNSNLSQDRLQIEQLLLQEIGFVVQVWPMPRTIELVQLALQEQADEPKKKDVPPAAGAAAGERGQISAHDTASQPQPPARRLTPVMQGYCCEAPRVRGRKNYAGAGLGYRPGQGLRPFLLGRRDRAEIPLGDGSLSGRLLRDGGNLFGFNGAYSADYIGFEKLHRRLSFQLNGGTETEASRYLRGGLVDERRNGGSARAEIEAFRDRGGALLRVFGALSRNTVNLARQDAPDLSANVSAADLGAVFLYATSDTPYATSLRVEPALRYAPGIAGETRFERGWITARFNQLAPRDFTFDVTARLEHASAKTPVFELPSLGGETLRGFRRDDALGRSLWAVQTEIWTPLPLRTGLEESVRTFLRNSLKPAFFVDLGGVRGGALSAPGLRWAPGAGVRFLYGPLVMKLDWAYGFGPKATGGARGKVYFTAGTNLPF